ncbi:uncharacterized protein LOC144141636 [Haemaphysalis longicornis]
MCTPFQMRLAVAVVLFVVGSSHADVIDLYKPVKICSSLKLLEVVTNVCQTPLSLQRRQAAYGDGKGSRLRQLLLRSALKDENEAEMNKSDRKGSRHSPFVFRSAFKQEIAKDWKKYLSRLKEIYEQCCVKKCKPIIFLEFCRKAT